MQESAPLAALTTMRVGGPAARLVTVTTTDELVDAVREVDDADEPLLVLGGGSNLVIARRGLRGHRGAGADDRRRGRVRRLAAAARNVRVAAGEGWDGLVERSVAEGWAGLEALSGIPGSTGATPIQNVGAYGQEVSESVAQVRVWDRQTQRVRTFFGADCGFAYRDSRFKRDARRRYVVLDVLFQLRIADLSEPVRYADLARHLGVAVGARVPLATGPRRPYSTCGAAAAWCIDPDDPTTTTRGAAGSFFTNPVLGAAAWAAVRARVAGRLGDDVEPPSWPEATGTKTSAAWLIERAGFGKGYGAPGPAALSSKHTLAVTNRGTATAADVLALAREVRARRGGRVRGAAGQRAGGRGRDPLAGPFFASAASAVRGPSLETPIKLRTQRAG